MYTFQDHITTSTSLHMCVSFRLPASGNYLISLTSLIHGEGSITLTVNKKVGVGYSVGSRAFCCPNITTNLWQQTTFIGAGDELCIYVAASKGSFALYNNGIQFILLDNQPITHTCNCETQLLMTRGCQCGGT